MSELDELRAEVARLREVLRKIIAVPRLLKLPRDYSPETEAFFNQLESALREDKQ